MDVGEEMNIYNIYVYGAGKIYQKILPVIRGYYPKIQVRGVITSNDITLKSIDGYKCHLIDDIVIDNDCYVVIAVKEWEDIFKKLLERGVNRKKIIIYRAFFYPIFDIDDYIKLKNSDVTILSNYCLGGHIYNMLGMEMLSPTINMFCSGMDYIRFLNDYENYLKGNFEEDTKNISTVLLVLRSFFHLAF